MPDKRQVLFVQGGGEGTYDEWDSKLVASLRQGLGRDYDVHYPRMPGEDEPSYARWKKALQRELSALRKGVVVVGHSVGAAIVLKLLAEESRARELAAIFSLAAPFVGSGGWSFDELRLPRDFGERLPKGVPIHFYHGLKDEIAPPSHLELYARLVPQAHLHRLEGRDHQFNDDLSEVAAELSSL